MASAGTVVVDFAAETAKFTAALKQVNTKLDDSAKSFKSLESFAKGAFGVLSAGALTSFAKATFDAANELDRLNQKTGIAISELSRLQYAAKQSDTEFTALTQGVTQFQNRLSKGDATDAVHALGLELTTIRTLGVEQQLYEIAKGFEKLTDPADKVRISMELFGKAGADLIPFLSQGPDQIRKLAEESDRLGATLNEKTVAQLDRAEKAANRFKAALDGVITGVLAGSAMLLLPDEALTQQEEFNRLFAERVRMQQAIRRLETPGETVLSQDQRTASIQRLNGELAENAKQLADINSKEQVRLQTALATQDAFTKAQAEANRIVELPSLTFGLTPEQREAEAEAQENFANLQLEQLAKFNERTQQLATDRVAAVLKTEEDGRIESARNAQFWRDYETQAVLDAEALQLKFKKDGLNAAHSLLTAFGGKYQKYAQAMLVFDKAQAIASIAINTREAAMSAYAYGATPILGVGLAAAAIAYGAAQIAAVSSTFIGKNSLGASGSPANPVFTSTADTSFQNEERPTARSRQTTQVVFNGPIYAVEDFQRAIVDALRDVSDRDVIIFNGNSAQAQAIRTA